MKISVVTPSFNQGPFIEATIQSVLSQTRPPDEYIVMDGGSTDQTLDILKRYGHQLRFISEADKGQTDALNKAFKLTQYDIIGWLNSDDLYTTDALAQVEAAFASDPSLDVVYGHADFIDAVGKKIGHYPTLPIHQKNIFLDCILCQPAVFFKKEVLTRLGYLDTQYHFGMDYEFWLRLFTQGAKFKFIPHVLAKQRLHATTKTTQGRLEANKESCDMLYQYAGKIPLHRAIIYAIACAKEKSKKTFFLFSFLYHLKIILRHYKTRLNFRLIRQSIYYLFYRLHAFIFR